MKNNEVSKIWEKAAMHIRALTDLPSQIILKCIRKLWMATILAFFPTRMAGWTQSFVKKAKIAHFLDKSSKLGSFKQAKTRYVLQVAPHGIPFTFKSWTTSPIKSCLTDTSWTLTTPASKIQSTGPAESNLPTSLSTTNSECFFFDVLFLGIQRSVNSLVLECVPTFEFQVYSISL